jgi:hypothetical protein
MAYDDILRQLNEPSIFEKLMAYVGNACFDPDEFG